MVGTIPVRPFNEWLVAQADRRDPVGDLAAGYIQDVRDKCCYATTTAGLLQHIDRKHRRFRLALTEAVYQAGKEWQDGGWER